MLQHNPLYEISSSNPNRDFDPDEMSPQELLHHSMDKREKIRLVQQQMAALSLPCVMEIIYRDESGSVTNTERSEWSALYSQLLGESLPI